VGVVPRKPRSLPVRFGVDRASLRGMTVNVSTEGMFVRVPTPEDGGQSILIYLDLDGHTLPLRGLVMWSRLRAEPERPAGMGIRLSEPPALYQSFVASLP
jgi:Tfp pilus assembly protein PilZ